MLVAKIEVSAHYLGLETDLSANEFAGGTQSAQGYLHLESFAVEDGIPTWRYAIADALLEQRIFMAPGANTSYLRLCGVQATACARPYQLSKTAPAWIRALAQASDQFIVRRSMTGGAPGRAPVGAATSIIAGYPWFTDWGRDTMISLPGLATALGRYDVAAGILRTYASFVDRGMLPN